jgi:PIN domain nuclease of toxin-antitoxin system
VRRLLLDTHVVLWWLGDDQRLSEAARRAIAETTNDILVSAASVWEMAIKRSLGKLTAPAELLDVVAAQGFGWLPVRADHAGAVGSLPWQHRDPFDRLLVAQARVEGVPVVTSDPAFAAYGVGVLW